MNPALTILSIPVLWALSFASFRGGHAWLGVPLALLSIVPLLTVSLVMLFLASWSVNASTESEIRSRQAKINIAAVISGVIAIALGAMSFKSFAKGNVGTGTALVVADAIPVAFTVGVISANLS